MARPILPTIATHGKLSALVNMLVSHAQFYSSHLVHDENLVTDFEKYLPDTGATMTYTQGLAALRAACPITAAAGCIGTYLDSRYVDIVPANNPYDPINRLPLSLFNNPGDLLHYESGPNAGQLVYDSNQPGYHVDFRNPASQTKLINAIVSELTTRKTNYGIQIVMLDNWIFPDMGITVGAQYYPITIDENINYLQNLSSALHAIDYAIIPNFGGPFQYYGMWQFTDAQMIAIAQAADGIVIERPCGFFPLYWADTPSPGAPPITPTVAIVSEWVRRYTLFIQNNCRLVMLADAHQSNKDSLGFPAGYEYDAEFLSGVVMNLQGPFIGWAAYLPRYNWIKYSQIYGAPTSPSVQNNLVLEGTFGANQLFADFGPRLTTSGATPIPPQPPSPTSQQILMPDYFSPSFFGAF